MDEQERLRDMGRFFVNSTLVQLTLRRWKHLNDNPRFHFVLIALILVGTVMDPFGMNHDRSFIDRFVFSLSACLILTSIAIVIIPPAQIFLEMKGIRRKFAIVMACSLANFAMVPAYLWLLSTRFEQMPPNIRVVELFILVSLLISFLSYRILGLKFSDRTPEEKAAAFNAKGELGSCYANPSICAVQAKIPVHKRGIILSMIAHDHYVQINTDKGSELILMRLSDAVDICESENGIRIHRSAWVSREGIKTLKKEGRRTLVVAPCGRELPVSRSAESSLRRFVDNHLGGENRAVSA